MENTGSVNTIAMYETVTDRHNKKHKIYSVRFKDLQTVTSFTEKYNPDYFGEYMLAPVIDDEGNVEIDSEGNINYDNGFKEDLMEIVLLALDNRETQEQVEEWLDLVLAREIFMKFLGLSQFKKKTDVKEATSWDRLFASLVQNTSMTMKDIGDLRVNQMEGLLEGIAQNAEELKRELNGEHKTLEGDDAINALLGS